MLAAAKGRQLCVKLLLRRRARTELVDKKRKTALDYAIDYARETGSDKCVTAIAEHIRAEVT